MKAAVEQTAIPGTEPKRKRESALDKARIGDLLIAVVGAAGDVDPVVEFRIAAIEQVSDGVQASEVVARWKDQGILNAHGTVEVWEARPGMYYRKRGRR